MRTYPRGRCLAGFLLACLFMSRSVESAEPEPPGDYLPIVRAYADALLEHGRDTYGRESSPLFATTLNRRSMTLFEGKDLVRISEIPREGWDIRPHDRMVTGANPMHQENLYQVLYALTDATGEPRYAQEADASLKWFLEHCQSDTTGLLAWGEHIGWDLVQEKATGGAHEFFRPWVLWERCYTLSPDACVRFARGLWEHQIGDQATGNYSRHANYWKHQPDTGKHFPRHGGFYIATWATAYRHTQDPVFLTAIATVLNHFDARRNAHSDAIPCQSDPPFDDKLVWPESNLSLAVDLWDAAKIVPDDLAKKMQTSATRTDKVFLAVPFDLSPQGKGFITECRADTLVAERYGKGTWGAGYGSGGDAQAANLCMLRYRQVRLEGYKRLILQTGERYAGTTPDLQATLHPGTLGDVILLMLACHELTGDAKYLHEADRFADLAIRLFLSDGSPLPLATTQHTHYEAITRSDTLMMALLKLQLTHAPGKKPVSLILTDR